MADALTQSLAELQADINKIEAMPSITQIGDGLEVATEGNQQVLKSKYYAGAGITISASGEIAVSYSLANGQEF